MRAIPPSPIRIRGACYTALLSLSKDIAAAQRLEQSKTQMFLRGEILRGKRWEHPATHLCKSAVCEREPFAHVVNSSSAFAPLVGWANRK
jgi:hypothetical protein